MLLEIVVRLRKVDIVYAQYKIHIEPISGVYFSKPTFKYSSIHKLYNYL